MSETNSGDEELSAENNGDEVEPKSKFTKKKLIFGGLAAVVVIAGVATGAFIMTKKPSGTAVPVVSQDQPATYIDVNPMVVNLHSSDGQARFLKIHFFLVPASAAKGDSVKARLPLIVDAYQPFLRELRPEDLAGSAAVFRIKEELLVRANATVGTGTVKDVLIQDLIQQ